MQGNSLTDEQQLISRFLEGGVLIMLQDGWFTWLQERLLQRVTSALCVPGLQASGSKSCVVVWRLVREVQELVQASRLHNYGRRIKK